MSGTIRGACGSSVYAPIGSAARRGRCVASHAITNWAAFAVMMAASAFGLELNRHHILSRSSTHDHR